VSFAAITLCVASQRVFIVAGIVVYFVIDSFRKLLDTPSYLQLPPVIVWYKKTLYRQEFQCKASQCLPVLSSEAIHSRKWVV
jgi:hypothetical protein